LEVHQTHYYKLNNAIFAYHHLILLTITLNLTANIFLSVLEIDPLISFAIINGICLFDAIFEIYVVCRRAKITSKYRGKSYVLA